MNNIFYLATNDYLPLEQPRECKYLSEHMITETGQCVYRVSITPPLPQKERKDYGENLELGTLLIGMINDKWSLSNIGKSGFMVDIYLINSGIISKAIHAKDILHVGIGTLHSSLKEALDEIC